MGSEEKAREKKGAGAGDIIQTQAQPLDRGILLDVIARQGDRRLKTPEDRDILGVIERSLRQDSKFVLPWTRQEQHYLDTHPHDLWLSYLIYRFKMMVLPKLRVAADFPVYLLIEPVSSCNLRCVMCFQIDRTFTKKPFMGLMAFELFQKIVDEAQAGGTCAITLASRGEPTMHPDLPRMLAYATGKFIDLKLNTNATRLTEQLSHDILQSGVNELVFSVDGADKKTYEAIRVKGNFDEVVENIDRFHRIRREHYPHSVLRTRISGVLVDHTQDIGFITNFWKRRVDDVVFVRREDRWDTYNNPVRDDFLEPCRYLWERMYVWFDGVTNVCDVDYKSELSPGRLSESTIREIWQGEVYRALRQKHIEGRRTEYCPCDRCGIA